MARGRKKTNDRTVSSEGETFLKLLNEGDEMKLAQYFSRYGIAPELAQLNLEILIAEELRDLGFTQESKESDLKYGA
jgi:hypothetical protein